VERLREEVTEEECDWEVDALAAHIIDREVLQRKVSRAEAA
jgi:hypothetical protein